MMLDYLGWGEAADLVHRAIEAAILRKTVTYDLARQIDGATEVRCSEFAAAITAAM